MIELRVDSGMAAMGLIVPRPGRGARYDHRVRERVIQAVIPGGAMPPDRAVPVMLSAGERRTLKKRARAARTAYRDWLRAQIVLAAARGRASARIAADLRVSVDTVRKWRGRSAARGLDGLKDLPRPRAAAADQRAGTGRGLRAGLPAARHDRGAAVTLDRSGTGRRTEIPGRDQRDLAIICAADLGRASPQALALPVLALSPRPGLRRQGHRDPRPVPGFLPRPAIASRGPDRLGC